MHCPNYLFPPEEGQGEIDFMLFNFKI